MTPADLARIEEIIDALDHDQYHGCVTGDCPHEHANQCHDDLVKLLREHAKDAESLRSLLAAAKAAQATAEKTTSDAEDFMESRPEWGPDDDFLGGIRNLASEKDRFEAIWSDEFHRATALDDRVSELERALAASQREAARLKERVFEHFYALLSTPLLSPQAAAKEKRDG